MGVPKASAWVLIVTSPLIWTSRVPTPAPPLLATPIIGVAGWRLDSETALVRIDLDREVAFGAKRPRPLGCRLGLAYVQYRNQRHRTRTPRVIHREMTVEDPRPHSGAKS